MDEYPEIPSKLLRKVGKKMTESVEEREWRKESLEPIEENRKEENVGYVRGFG